MFQNILQNATWQRNKHEFVLFFPTRYFILKHNIFSLFKRWEIVETGSIHYDEPNKLIKARLTHMRKLFRVTIENEQLVTLHISSCGFGQKEYEQWRLRSTHKKISFPKIPSIQYAAFCGMIPIVDHFLDQGVTFGDTNDTTADFFNETPLQSAIKGGNKELFDHLIERGLNPLDRANGGLKLLEYAIEYDERYMVQYLLGSSVLDMLDDQEKISIMRKAGTTYVSDDVTLMLYKELLAYPEMKSELYENSAYYMTLCYGMEHFECRPKERLASINYLLGYDLDLEKKNGDGDTAFLAAVNRGAIEIIKLLVKKGIDVHVVDKEGKSAADIADIITDPYNLGVAEPLMDIVTKLGIKRHMSISEDELLAQWGLKSFK